MPVGVRPASDPEPGLEAVERATVFARYVTGSIHNNTSPLSAGTSANVQYWRQAYVPLTYCLVHHALFGFVDLCNRGKVSSSLITTLVAYQLQQFLIQWWTQDVGVMVFIFQQKQVIFF